MSGPNDPTRERPQTASRPRAPAWLALLAFLSGGWMGGCTLFAVASLSVDAPWPVPATMAAGAILGALVLRWSLERSRRGPCGAVRWLGEDPAFTCRRWAGHRGDHRQDGVGWSRTGLSYQWRGRGKRRPQ